MMAATAHAADTQRVRFLDLTSVLPASWSAEQPTSSMRVVQFGVAEDSGRAEFIVYYFSGGGGDVQANVERWRGQFRAADGAPVEVLRKRPATADPDLEITYVELRGDYARGAGTGPVGAYQPDRILIALIGMSPRHGRFIVQFHGPAATVEVHRAAIERFIGALRPVAAPSV